jgi:hypothetical protein
LSLTFVSHFLFSLEENGIGPAGAQAIASALEENNTLTELK